MRSASARRGPSPHHGHVPAPSPGESTMEFAKQQPTVKAPADWFTGDVWFDVIHAGQEPSRRRANLVRFSPGARTHWHSHALGQALYVVSGTALIGTRDGTVFEAHRS
ncbi:hypothetical protein GCM10010320_35430 [Streptomyces caelestis]|nr:hypothetical protein GCM10010320_35430 [Streptomyces caelestis]